MQNISSKPWTTPFDTQYCDKNICLKKLALHFRVMCFFRTNISWIRILTEFLEHEYFFISLTQLSNSSSCYLILLRKFPFKGKKSGNIRWRNLRSRITHTTQMLWLQIILRLPVWKWFFQTPHWHWRQPELLPLWHNQWIRYSNSNSSSSWRSDGGDFHDLQCWRNWMPQREQTQWQKPIWT